MRLLLLLSLVFSQQQVTDANFYGAIYKGMHLVRFTAEWSDDNKQNFYQGKFIVDGDSAHMGTQMMIIPSKKVPETVRKLRLRNFPSVVLFKDGKKVKKVAIRAHKRAIVSGDPRLITSLYQPTIKPT